MKDQPHVVLLASNTLCHKSGEYQIPKSVRVSLKQEGYHI